MILTDIWYMPQTTCLLALNRSITFTLCETRVPKIVIRSVPKNTSFLLIQNDTKCGLTSTEKWDRQINWQTDDREVTSMYQPAYKKGTHPSVKPQDVNSYQKLQKTEDRVLEMTFMHKIINIYQCEYFAQIYAEGAVTSHNLSLCFILNHHYLISTNWSILLLSIH